MKVSSANHIIFDIGSNKIAALAVNISKTGECNVVGQTLQHSSGFRAGWISNFEAAENSIISSIYTLEKECHKSINEVTISLSGEVKSYYISQTLKLNNQAITKQDVKKLIQKALTDFSISDQEVIHYFPIEYCLDKINIVENPVGMYAKEMTCQIHIIAANSLMIKNLTNCFAKCHIEVNDIVLSIYAAGLNSLSDDEKKTGAIVIDLGSHITSFGVFLDGKILYVGSVPIGSNHITTDIARTLSLSLKTSEKLKILYGDVRPDLFNKNESIKISDFESENEYNSDIVVSISELAGIIKPRVQEILKLLKREYDHIEMDHLIAKRIILTGGGSGLCGIKNLISEVFQKKVKTARPDIISGFTENHNVSMYSTALGMVKVKTLKYKKAAFQVDEYEEAGWFRKTILWFKENV